MTRGSRAKTKLIDESITEDTTECSPAEVEKHGPETKNGIITNCYHVKVRRDADYKSDVLETLSRGDKVVILGKSGNFYKVSTRLNDVAYISLDFIKEE